MRYLLPLLALALASTTTAQPTWRFHLVFEDGTGARDTLWLIYDTNVVQTQSHWPVNLYEYEQSRIGLDYNDGEFHVFTINDLIDSTNSMAFPYSWYPIFETGNTIDAINWVPPMTITWDTSLFHAPYLPYDQGHIRLAVMNGLAFSQFNDGSLDFGLVSMLNRDSINIGFLWDYLFPFGIYFGPVDDLGLAAAGTPVRPLKVWPNPAKGSIQVDLAPSRVESLTITDVLGRTWLHGPGALLVQPLDITLLPPGRYFIHVRSNNHIHHGTFEKIH